MDFRKLQHSTMEELRKVVVDRVKAGVSASRIAQDLGLSVRAVFRWLRMEREGGKVALEAKPIPGRPSKVSESQLEELLEIVRKHTPYDFGFDTFLWTARILQSVLTDKLGVSLHRSNVAALLHRLGLVPRKPLYQAYEQDPRAVHRWKEKEYPALRERVRKERATLYFLDEMGVRTTDTGGRTWSDKGVRPVVEKTGQNVGVNVLSALSPQGALRFMVLEGNFNAAAFVEFLERLARGSRGKVYLVLDHHPVHHSRKVEQKVKDLAGTIELVFLPAYAPQVNPDEGVWSLTKAEVKSKEVGSREELREAVSEILRSLAKLPGYLKRIFLNPQFQYALDTS